MTLHSNGKWTLDGIEARWLACRTQEQRRELYEELVGTERGWFHACRHAVCTSREETVQSWLNKSLEAKHQILHFRGDHMPLLRAHLLSARWALPNHHRTTGIIPDQAFSCFVNETGLVPGLLHDLVEELGTGHIRQPMWSQSMPALLIDRVRDTGVVATLTLELMSAGNQTLYPVPACLFVDRDAAFCQAAIAACEHVLQTGLWPQGWDVRWHVQRRDGKPLLPLTGPSMGGAFALGLVKLLATA